MERPQLVVVQARLALDARHAFRADDPLERNLAKADEPLAPAAFELLHVSAIDAVCALVVGHEWRAIESDSGRLFVNDGHFGPWVPRRAREKAVLGCWTKRDLEAVPVAGALGVHVVG